MGPWLCSHGNETVTFPSSSASSRLQWGRGCVATEISRLDAHGTWSYLRLQWGRGCVATEMFGRDGSGWARLHLQWGRGCVATEMDKEKAQ